MSNSPRIGLQYLDAAQAQKHVTVNEALARLDVAAAGQVADMDLSSPPVSPAEGSAHIVASGAVGDWTGRDGGVAVFLNGGWDFIQPWSGWRLWVIAEPGLAIYDGDSWQLADQQVSAGGALSAMRIAELDHVVSAGATSETSAFVPDKAVVVGVTARVTSAVTGATSWSLGATGSPDRYGSGFGVSQNAFAHGVTGSPIAYFGGSTLLMTATGGNFTGGAVRLDVHYIDIAPPRPV